jgi:hypothetical protein
MATRTAAELATAVLRRLGEISAEEDPSAEDSEYLQDLYDEKLAEIGAEFVGAERIYWTAAATPLAVFNIMVDIVANSAGPAFEVKNTPDEIAAREEVLLKRLKKHVAKPTTGLPVRAVYY